MPEEDDVPGIHQAVQAGRVPHDPRGPRSHLDQRRAVRQVGLRSAAPADGEERGEEEGAPEAAQDRQEALAAEEHPVEDSDKEDQEEQEEGVRKDLASDAPVARQEVPAQVGQAARHQKVEKGSEEGSQEGRVQEASKEGGQAEKRKEGRSQNEKDFLQAKKDFLQAEKDCVQIKVAQKLKINSC